MVHQTKYGKRRRCLREDYPLRFVQATAVWANGFLAFDTPCVCPDLAVVDQPDGSLGPAVDALFEVVLTYTRDGAARECLVDIERSSFFGYWSSMSIGVHLASCFLFGIKAALLFFATSTVVPAAVHHGLME